MTVSIVDWIERVRRCRANRERPPVLLAGDESDVLIRVTSMDVFGGVEPYHVIVSVEGQGQISCTRDDVMDATLGALARAANCLRSTSYAHWVLGTWRSELDAARKREQEQEEGR